MSRVHGRSRAIVLAVATLLSASILTACSLVVGGEDKASEPTLSEDSADAGGASGEPRVRDVVLVSHDSFALPKKLIKRWESETGYRLKQRPSGDTGTLTNKLVLTQGNPLGDVAFGIDDTFAARALEADVFEPSAVELPAGADAFALPDGSDRLIPVDNGNVCVNIDTTWFDAEGLAPPQTLADLVEPAYRDLFVIPGAPTSSPGMAFLLATIAAYGDAWPEYWADLMANGAKLTSGWSDAYFVDFTAGGEDGRRPIVVSYDSSPAFTVDDGTSSTRALLDTCYRQVEYAGILTGAGNPTGAAAFLDFLLTPQVQAKLPTSMYVFPVRNDVTLPEDWARFAKRPTDPASLDPAEVAAQRDQWLQEWTEVTTR